ncbi:MAG: CAP domain-containing protein, partial [Ruminococcus sp.]|nr:CAP domain-containing protein [Ruminococcus sp.]
DSRLTEAAMARAKELAVKFDHGRPNGTNGPDIVWEYISSAGTNGENIHMSYGTGYHDGKYIYSSLESSTGHYNTMIRANSNYIGVGVYYVYKNGYKYTYAVQLFCRCL